MFLEDFKEPVEGIFSLKCYDINDALLDEWTEKNLIVNTARTSMANIVAGIGTATPINRVVLGTLGHIGTNVLDPKLVGGTYPPFGTFDVTRTQLFAEEDGSAYTYSINFNPSGTNNQLATVTSETDGVGTASTININVTGTSVVYTITINTDKANNTGSVPYTEAGLYSGTNLFSIKTFPARVKTNSTRFVITWTINF